MFFKNDLKIKILGLYLCVQCLGIDIMHASATLQPETVEKTELQAVTLDEVIDLFKESVKFDVEHMDMLYIEPFFQYVLRFVLNRYPFDKNIDLYTKEYHDLKSQNHEDSFLYKDYLARYLYLFATYKASNVQDVQTFCNYFGVALISMQREKQKEGAYGEQELDSLTMGRQIENMHFTAVCLDLVRSDQSENISLRAEYKPLMQKIMEIYPNIVDSDAKEADSKPKVNYPILLDYIVQKEKEQYSCTDQLFCSNVLSECPKILRHSKMSDQERRRFAYKRLQESRLRESQTTINLLKTFPYVMPIISKYLSCEKVLIQLISTNIIKSPEDFVSMLKTMDKVKCFDINSFGKSQKKVVSAAQDFEDKLIDDIISRFPLNISQLVEEVREKKVAELQQLADQERQRQEVIKQQEQIAKEMVRKNKAACRLEKRTHENLLREWFFTWMNDPHLKINQKKQQLKDCFDAFCKAIDHKKSYRKMIFEQEVLKPNREHALLVEASREQREAMPPVPETVPIIKKDKLDKVVEQVSRTNADSSQETTRLARIARRAHRAVWRNVVLGDVQRKYDKYESSVTGAIDARNARIALEKFNKQQKQKAVALQQEQAKSMITLFFHTIVSGKIVSALRQKQQVRQEARRAALSGPDAWSHHPYDVLGDRLKENPSLSVGNDQENDLNDFDLPVVALEAQVAQSPQRALDRIVQASNGQSGVKIRQHNPYALQGFGAARRD